MYLKKAKDFDKALTYNKIMLLESLLLDLAIDQQNCLKCCIKDIFGEMNNRVNKIINKEFYQIKKTNYNIIHIGTATEIKNKSLEKIIKETEVK